MFCHITKYLYFCIKQEDVKISHLKYLFISKEDWQSDRMRWTRNPVYPLWVSGV